jgi:hypothetical protein
VYCSLAQLKTYIGADTTDDDAFLTECIERAQAMIETHTGRLFECAADTTRTFDALRDTSANRRELRLDHDLCAITTVTNGDATTVAALSYVTEPRNARPYYALCLKGSTGLVWTYEDDPENAISIAGKWAYSTTPPADIEQACVRLAAYLYRQKDSSADLDRPIISADGTTLLPARIPADVQSAIGPYVRVRVV